MIDYVKRLAGPYTGKGLTSFTFSFKIFDSTDVYVATAMSNDETPSNLEYGTDYSVSMNEDQDATPGGTVTVPRGLSDGEILVIGSAVEYTQETQLTNYSRFPPEIINQALDRIVVQIQQIVERLGRTLSVPATSSTTPEGMIERLLSAQKEAQTGADQATEAASEAKKYRDEAKGYAEAAEVVSPISEEVKTVANNIASVKTVAADVENVDIVAENIDKVGRVSDNMGFVTSVGQNIDDVEAVSGNINSVNIVAGDLFGEEAALEDEDYGEYGDETGAGEVEITGGNIKVVADNIDAVKLLGQYAEDGTLEKAATSAEDAAASADKAKDWATKMDGLVDNEDYSSKYYANKAKTTVESAEASINDAKEAAVKSVQTAQSAAVSSVETAGSSAVEAVSESVSEAKKSADDALTSANAAKASENASASSASSASGSATTASQAASSASQSQQAAASSAKAASESASAASGSSNTATTKAAEAAGSASEAASSATAAGSAKTAAEAAAKRAEDAASSVGDPLGKEEAAQTYATKTEVTSGLQGKAAADHSHSLSLSGDASGTASLGSTEATLSVSLKDSGATAGAYGPVAGEALDWSGSFAVPLITIDAKGRVTAAKNISFTLPAAVTWESLSGKPSSFTPASHTHEISSVTGLQVALDAKANADELGALAKKNKITLDDIEGDIDLGEYA